MTLCQNSKTKYFGRLFLAFAMLLGGVFFTTSESKAAYEYEIPTFNENVNVITIPEYTGEAVLICYPSDGFTIDGNNSTILQSIFSTETNVKVSRNISYYENPPIGNKSWSGTSKCLLVKNYNSDIGLSVNLKHEMAYNAQTSVNFTITPNENDENTIFLLGVGVVDTDFRNYGGNILNASSTDLFHEISEECCWHGYSTFFWEAQIGEDITNYYFYNPGSGTFLSSFWQLNIGQASASPSNDYVMYYGNNPVYTPINSNYNLPVVYNVCDSWSAGDIILKLNNDNASSSEKLLTQCSGTFNFNSGAGGVEMSNTSYFTIENFRDDTILATSANFLSTVYTPLNASDGFIVWNFPAYQYFDYTKTATTTPLIFNYNVCSDENYSTSSKICIRNTSHPTNDPSSYCVNLETCSGTGNIELPVFSQENSLTLNFSYYDGNGDFQLGSNQFSIVYYNGTYDTRAKWLVQAGEIACSPEEWASDHWWINIKCGVFTGGVAVAQTLGNSAAAGVRILIGMLDGVFPFNLPIKIKQCWDNSETKLLPSELNKINILDESGNVKINIPTEWAESGSITIWGSDVWNATDESNEFFVFIRNLSKYLIWGIFILIFYLWGKSLIEK